MERPHRLSESGRVGSPGKENLHDQDPMSVVHRTQQAALRFYDVQLWSNVTRKLNDAELLLKIGRKDLALQHVAITRKFIADCNGTEAMILACQDTEEIIRHWPAPVPRSPQSSPRRRHSASRLQSPATSSQRIDSLDSDGLFARLMAELQAGPDTPSTHTSQQQTVQSPPLLPDGASTNTSTESNGSFEGIEAVLPRLRHGSSALRAQSSQPLAPTRQIEAIRPDTVQMVNGWGAQLPNSPSSFKNSEEASPRRHSFPYASPQLPDSPSARNARKASIHALPQPLLAHDSRPPLDASASAVDSTSNYSRRLSQDETSTILSDTPSLTKLASQIQSNPFIEGQSLVASRVRKLSIEDPASEQLLTGAPSAPGHPDSPPCSPLSQTFTPDDLPPEPASGSSPPGAPLGRRVLPPLLLDTLGRPSGHTSTLQPDPASSPHMPSPLREEFSASDHAPAPKDGKEETTLVSPTQVVFRKPTFSSRIPRPARRNSQSSTPTSPTSPAHNSAGPFTSTSTTSSSGKPHQDTPDHQPPSPTSTPVAISTDTSALPSVSQAASIPTRTTAASASSISSSSSASTRPRKRDSLSRVSRMAAQLEHREETHGSRSPSSSPVAARPPWQMPGRGMGKTATMTGPGSGAGVGTKNGAKGTTRRNSEQAGFGKWREEMVHGGSGAAQSQ